MTDDVSIAELKKLFTGHRPADEDPTRFLTAFQRCAGVPLQQVAEAHRGAIE
jgi:hypothetical protein